ncbi:hypothetical protein [uncultured Litoreibacter sp.]|uniref:hypothetical protein n=1 Tax=uncultured Litoreibacter sp. TaxID=1392394 RepID=UPI002638315C|nr:hypothetical protein [uncultured Litoreibacter sp.]
MTLKQKARYNRLQALSSTHKPRSSAVKGRVTRLATRLDQTADQISLQNSVSMHTMFMAA